MTLALYASTRGWQWLPAVWRSPGDFTLFWLFLQVSVLWGDAA